MDIKINTGIIAQFQNLDYTEYKDNLVGRSVDGQFFVKIEVGDSIYAQRKNYNLREEAGVLKFLNEKNCRTCVRLMLITEVSGEMLNEAIATMPANIDKLEPEKMYSLMVTEALEIAGVIHTPDLTMAVIEQKKLGVWNGDLTPQDILVDPKTKCIKLIDYDQATMLSEEQINMPNQDFFKWIDEDARERWGEYGMTGFLFNLKVEWDTHFKSFFNDNCFNLASTHLFQSQETTLNQAKIYHSFQTDDVFARGERTLDDREQLLDKIEFSEGERVLDVGCNAGLLCHYLHDRGCDVWGIDIDPAVIEGAQIIANIVGKPGINFQCHDVDNGGPIGYFDTIMLFSVIHHTSNIHENSARIAKLCNRIIIECRLKEQGAKPVNGKWIQTTVWQHPNMDSLIEGLENLFPKFKFARILGQGDRDRYVMELIKPSE